MQIVLPIIISIIIIYIRIWIINTIFSEKKIKINLAFKILLIWILLVWWLFIYKYFLTNLWIWNFNIINNAQPLSVLIFLIYCFLIVILLALIFQNWHKKFMQTILIWLLLFGVIAYWWYFIGINFVILYYLISAYAEEYMKFSAGNDLFIKQDRKNLNDLILFCILIWLGFSIIENLFYIANNIITHQNINVMNLLIGRWLVSSLLHVVATWLIWFVAIKFQNSKSKNLILPIVLWIISWFALHSLYNISLQYQLNYISIPLIILCFFLLTYLFFQSDSLYKQQ